MAGTKIKSLVNIFCLYRTVQTYEMCSLVPLKVGTNHASLIFMNIIMSAMEKVELHGFSLLDDLSCIRTVHVMATVAGGRFGLLGNVHHNVVCNPDLRAMIHKHMVRMT